MNSVDENIVEEIRRSLDRPVVLVGMMGSGKTRVGKQLASILGLKFIDSDHEIEQAADMEISEIFDRFGESYFRDGERRVVLRLLEEGPAVIATGGGAITAAETAQAIWSKALSIWLRADIEVIVQRTARKNNRPLLKDGDPEQILRDLALKRYPIYEKADIVLDSHNGPSEAIINQALDKIRNHLRQGQRRTEAQDRLDNQSGR